MQYTAVIIGCGSIGSRYTFETKGKGVYSHADACSRSRRVRLEAVCDRSKKVAESCADAWGLSRYYLSAEEMLRAVRPEIVTVCTPDDTHASMIEAALESEGIKAIVVEKPLALDAGAALCIADKAYKKGVTLAVNYTRRYAPGILRLRELIASGRVGNIQGVQGCYTKGLKRNGTHWLDLLRFLLGEIQIVRGVPSHDMDTLDPTLSVELKLTNGAWANLLGCSAEYYSIFEMDILGTTGRARIYNSGNNISLFNVDVDPEYTSYRSLNEVESFSGDLPFALMWLYDDIISCIETGRSPRCSASDGVEVIRLAEEALISCSPKKS